MPEPRDYAADPSCSSRCLYLPCYLSITSTPSDWRKSTRLSPSFLLGRAFSTWERGPASRPWNSSAEVSTSPRLRSPTRTMHCSASCPSRITMAGPSPWPMPASTSFSRRTCWSTLPILRACTPKSDACWRQAGAVSTSFRPTPGGFGPRWRLTSRRSRFSTSSLPRLFPQATPRAAELQRLREAWYRTARHTVGLCLPRRHGERGNVISELWLFHPRWWRRNFRDNGFAVVGDEPMGLFYTGEVLFGLRLGLAKRERLARVLGSSCHLFRLVPVPRR